MRSSTYYTIRSIVRAATYSFIVVAFFIATTLLTANLLTAFIGAAVLTGVYFGIRHMQDRTSNTH